MIAWSYKNFEDYLAEVFQKEEPYFLDDDLPDAFDAWLEEMPIDDWFKHGDNYAKIIKEINNGKTNS